MEDIFDLYQENLYNRSKSTSGIKFKQIHHRLSNMFNKRYSKVSPSSLKYFEFSEKLSPKKIFHIKSPKSKDRILNSLAQDHISNKDGYRIIDLPKSPFGRHKPYNDGDNFFEKHFLSPDSEKTLQQKSFQKKIGLLNKRIKRSIHKCISKKKNESDDMEVFNTPSGVMYCKKNKSVMKIYELENEKFKVLNKIDKKDNKPFGLKLFEIKQNEKKQKKSPIKRIINRLYSIKKKNRFGEISEKYHKLFEDELLNMDYK